VASWKSGVTSMFDAKRCDAAGRRPESYATVLGKLLAAAIIVTPLVAMLFPELNHRSGNTAIGRRRGSACCGAAVPADCAGGTPAPQVTLGALPRGGR
jgi:hypothetical protein